MKTIWNKKGIFLALVGLVFVIAVELLIMDYFDIKGILSVVIAAVVGIIYGSASQKLFKLYKFEY